MKKSRIFWGIGLLAIAILLILDTVGVTFGIPEEISVWQIIFGGIFVFIAIRSLIKLKFWGIFFPLTFTIMIFEKQLASLLRLESGDIASTWEFLLVALLLTIGAALLTPKRRSKNTNHSKNGHKGNRTHYIDCSANVGEFIENNMGFCEVFFTNTQMYNGNGSVRLENNLGRINIHLPKDWTASINIENNLGSVDSPDITSASGLKTLNIMGENNLGKISIIRD